MPFQAAKNILHLLNHAADENQSDRYFRYSFTVPEGCGRLTLSMDIETKRFAQIPLILFDSIGNARLIRAANGTVGAAHTQYTICPSAADEGCVPGPIPAGVWKLLLYKRRMHEDVDALITVEATLCTEMTEDELIESNTLKGLRESPFSAAHLNENPGWYCGELHTHSSESTGHTSLEAVVLAARKKDIDFLALTDHFSISHWRKLQEVFDGKPPLLLQSMEVSGDFGHANVHGLSEWLNPLVDDNDEITDFLGLAERPSMEKIADAAHKQGGLFCLNHALSGIMGWRYREFPVEKADLYEVYCASELSSSVIYPTHWDLLLTHGLHVTGIASSDSHHPTRNGAWKLGQALTWVEADSLSQTDILRALKAGHAYVSVDGARMNMTGSCGEQKARMGDMLYLNKGDEAVITIDLIDHPAGNLFLYADGWIIDTIYYDHPGHDTYTLRLPESWIAKGGESYIRVEFHTLRAKRWFFGIAFRDYKTTRLISNPIWLKRKEKIKC